MHTRSKLTRKFMPYVVAQKEKELGKSLVQFMNLGNLEVNRLIFLIQLGNSTSPKKERFCQEEEAAKLLEDYLAEGNSIIKAYIDTLGDLDLDMGILKDMGITAEELYEDLRSNAAKRLPIKPKDTEAETNPFDS